MPKRIQLSRQKGWRKPEGAVVVTRQTIFGNPWACGGNTAFWWPRQPSGWLSTLSLPEPDLSRAEAVDAYRAWLEGQAIARHLRPDMLTTKGKRAFWDALALRRAAIFERLPDIKGRDLCCYCQPSQPCHADVLLSLANMDS